MRVSVGEVDDDVVADALRLSTSARSTLASTRTVGPWHASTLHAAAVAIAVVAQVACAAVRAGLGCADGLDDSDVVDVATTT